MTSFYLATALLIAVMIGHRRAALRALGRVLAAACLMMIVTSIILANTDGTFAAARNNAPLWLNLQAALAVLAAGALLWSARKTLKREALPTQEHTPLTRLLHWASAALVIAAYPMGQFLTVLAPNAPERAEFLATHLAIGGAIFLLVAARLVTRLLSKAPPTPLKSMAAHTALYATLIAVNLTGFALAPEPVNLYGLTLPRLPPSATAETLHRLWLPLLLAALFVAHLGGAVRAIRRMAR